MSAAHFFWTSVLFHWTEYSSHNCNDRNNTSIYAKGPFEEYQLKVEHLVERNCNVLFLGIGVAVIVVTAKYFFGNPRENIEF